MQINFDASAEAAQAATASRAGGSRQWTCKPDGLYRVLITEATGTESPGKQRALIKFAHVSPSWANKFELEGFNLVHTNPQAQAISRERFAKLSLAVGLAAVGNITELVNRPLVIKLGKKPAKPGREQYADANGFEQTILEFYGDDPTLQSPHPAAVQQVQQHLGATVTAVTPQPPLPAPAPAPAPSPLPPPAPVPAPAVPAPAVPAALPLPSLDDDEIPF